MISAYANQRVARTRQAGRLISLVERRAFGRAGFPKDQPFLAVTG